MTKRSPKRSLPWARLSALLFVAEGVETQEQEDFLRDHVCDEMQGFYFSKPVTPDQFGDLLRNHDPSLKKID